MTKIAVFRENAGVEGMSFRAVTVRNQAMGRTAGEALDALASQLSEDEADTLIIVRSLAPDRFFSAAQRQRLVELMARWQTARDHGEQLSADEQSALESLIDAEVRGATERAAALRHEMAP